MQVKIRTELKKKLDEHECVFSCTSEAPIDFLIGCVEAFKDFLEKRKKEIAAEAAHNNSENLIKE